MTKRYIAAALAACMLLLAGCRKGPEPAENTFDAAAELGKAEQLFLEGNYEEVILTLETVLEIEPANVQGYLRLSDAYLLRGDREKALQLLQKGFELTGDEQIAQRIKGMTEAIEGIVQVSGGDEASARHTLLLNDKGEVFFIGNMRQRVGGITYDNFAMTPKKIEGLSNVRRVFAGNRGHFVGNYVDLAITENDELYIWGLDADRFFSADDHNGSKPARLMGDVKDAFVADHNIYVIKNSGELVAFGTNHDGQKGTGSAYTEEFYDQQWTHDYEEYLRAEHVMDGVQKVKAGFGRFQDELLGDSEGYFAFSLDEANTLYGWGTFGIRDEGGRIVKCCLNEPTVLANNVKDMDATESDLYIVTAAGKLQKTELEAIGRDGPLWQDIETGTVPMAKVSCGSAHFVAMDALGVVYIGGENTLGQLGVSAETTMMTYEGESLKPLGETRFLDAVASDESSYAIDGNGVLHSWGNNDCGQLGNGRRGLQKNAAEPTFLMSGVKSTHAYGARETFILMENGDLYVAGSGYVVEKVTGGMTEEAFTPVKIMEEVAMVEPQDGGVVKTDNTLWLPTETGYEMTMEDVIFYTSSDENSFVIRSDNSLWGWGKNYGGQLGLGWYNDVGAVEDNSVAEPMHIMDNVASVSLMYNGPSSIEQGGATFILTLDGALYHCGYRGNGTMSTPENYWELPTEAMFALTPEKLDENVACVFGFRGIDKMFYVKEDGELISWSDYTGGIFYDSGAEDYMENEHRSSIRSNVAMAQESILLDRDGKCYIFGGQVMVGFLGLDETKWKEKAAEYGEGKLICQLMLEDVKAVATSWGGDDESYYAVKTNGDLYVWGNNIYGQLGLGEAGITENIFAVALPE
ncbi:MAG: tetratricopeptide repeat protein [Clostridia bacterium]|nr:tetratricopeptide repeat protein [Clostridia bacterium]